MQHKEIRSHSIPTEISESRTRSSCCSQAGVPCVMNLQKGRCSECARHGHTCNSQVIWIEHEEVRKSRGNLAAQLEEAEEEVDALAQKSTEHRARIRSLRKQLIVKDQKGTVAQDLEVAYVADAGRLEREMFAGNAKPIPTDLSSFDPYSVDGGLHQSPKHWSVLNGDPFPVLGFTHGDFSASGNIADIEPSS